MQRRIPIPECTLVFSQLVLEGSTRLSNIHFGALGTGDFVDDTCVLVLGYRVLWVYYLVPEGAVWVKGYPDIQRSKDSSDCFR